MTVKSSSESTKINSDSTAVQNNISSDHFDTEAAAGEEPVNILAPEGHTFIEAQTFEITLPSGVQAVFASYAPDDSSENVLFQIEQRGTVRQRLSDAYTPRTGKCCFNRACFIVCTTVYNIV